jgi:hypothetical protein
MLLKGEKEVLAPCSHIVNIAGGGRQRAVK